MPTTQKPLTMEMLNLIDQGKIAIAFNQALRTICTDIQDRPGDRTKRKVILTIEQEPQLEKDTGKLDLINTRFHIETKLPKRSSDEYPLMPSGNGSAYFRPESPYDPRQFDLYTGPTNPSDDAQPAAGDHEPMSEDGAS